MGVPNDPTIERGEDTEPVDVVEGPVGSARLKEPSDVEGSVPSVEPDDLDVEARASSPDPR